MNYSISNYKKILIYILTIFFSKMLYSVDKEFVIKDINKFELKSVSGNFYRNTYLYGKSYSKGAFAHKNYVKKK